MARGPSEEPRARYAFGVVDGPYRSTKIRGGVALPRRAQTWWQVAVGLGASTWLFVIGSFAVTEVREEGSVLHGRVGWFFLLGAFVLAVIGPLSAAIVTGRSTRTVRALGIALVPALLAELWGTTRLPAWKLPSIADLPHVVGAEVVLDVASARVGGYAVTSVAAFTVAIACTGFVLGVRGESARAPLAPSIVAVVAALGFAALRLRDWHRDGFVGALPVFGLVAVAALAPMLRGRARALADWHDAHERRAVQNAGWVALASTVIATLAAERTLLAYEESWTLTALRRWAYSFDTRSEHVHTLASSIRAHHLALALLAGIFVALLASAARDLAPRRWVGWVPVVMTVTVVALSAWTERRVLGILVEPPGPAVPSGVTLPSAAQDPSDLLPRPRTFLSLVEQPEPRERPRAFVADRRAPTRRLFEVTRDWSGGWVGVVTTRGPAPVGLGPHVALIGPSWSIIDFDIGTMENTKSGRRVIVLDEGTTARLRVLGDGPVRGISLRRDDDAARQRLRLGSELGTIESTMVAPSLTGDIQALVDLLEAVHDVVRTRVTITSNYQDVADKMDAP